MISAISTRFLEFGRTGCQAQFAAGHYTFDNPSVGPACAPAIAEPAGLSAALVIPSGEVKLNRGFDISSSAPTTILIDFDGDKSVHETGNGRFMMSPVIGIVSVQ